jgi:uncharacterized protein DUF3892
MPAYIQVSCITRRDDGDGPQERIDYVGGINSDGTPWKLPADEAIAGIEAGNWSLWTLGGGRFAFVVVATHDGRKYLKTDRDQIEPDGLLALPECP